MRSPTVDSLCVLDIGGSLSPSTQPSTLGESFATSYAVTRSLKKKISFLFFGEDNVEERKSS